MGTDIHMYAEIYNGKKWKKVGEVFENYWHKEFPDEPEFTDEPYSVRCYDLFGLLAGVRNHSLREPISEPKGLPKDVSLEVYKSCKLWDGHSKSWLSLRELMEFDWSELRGLSSSPELEWFFTNTLSSLSALGDPDRVRIVFWFDS